MKANPISRRHHYCNDSGPTKDCPENEICISLKKFYNVECFFHPCKNGKEDNSSNKHNGICIPLPKMDARSSNEEQ